MFNSWFWIVLEYMPWVCVLFENSTNAQFTQYNQVNHSMKPHLGPIVSKMKHICYDSMCKISSTNILLFYKTSSMYEKCTDFVFKSFEREKFSEQKLLHETQKRFLSLFFFFFVKKLFGKLDFQWQKLNNLTLNDPSNFLSIKHITYYGQTKIFSIIDRVQNIIPF